MCLGALSARATAPKARSCFSGGDQNGGARTRRAPQAKQRLRSPPGAGIGPKQCPRPKGRTGNATRRTDSTIGTGDYGQSRTAGSLIILCNGGSRLNGAHMAHSLSGGQHRFAVVPKGAAALSTGACRTVLANARTLPKRQRPGGNRRKLLNCGVEPPHDLVGSLTHLRVR
jgi:hypothetical protein